MLTKEMILKKFDTESMVHHVNTKITGEYYSTIGYRFPIELNNELEISLKKNFILNNFNIYFGSEINKVYINKKFLNSDMYILRYRYGRLRFYEKRNGLKVLELGNINSIISSCSSRAIHDQYQLKILNIILCFIDQIPLLDIEKLEKDGHLESSVAEIIQSYKKSSNKEILSSLQLFLEVS